MLEDVQNIIRKIKEVIDTRDDFSAEILEFGVSIKIKSEYSQDVVYHGYELHLMDLTTKKLGNSLDFKIIEDAGNPRFVITTDANFNLMSYINTKNNVLRNNQSDLICVVYISEKLSSDSVGDYSILTGYTNGTWKRYDMAKSEILYAAAHDLEIVQDENGSFWYPELIKINHLYFDELQALQKSSKKDETTQKNVV